MKTKLIIIAILTVIVLAGCSTTKKSINAERSEYYTLQQKQSIYPTQQLIKSKL